MKKQLYSKRFLLTLTALAIAFCFGQPQVSNVTAQTGTGIIRVATTGSDTTGCGSVAQPCRTIQYAADSAASGDTIRLAAGTYTSSGSAVLTFYGGTTKPIVIEGGYSTGNWNSYAPTTNVTIIDGQNSRRGLFIGGWNITLKGVTIQNGRVTSSSFPGPYGGGLYCVNSSGVTLTDVTFANNVAQGNTGSLTTVAGGGAAFYLCNLTLNNVRFNNNRAIGGNASPRGAQALGGGLFVADKATVVGYNVTATNNLAQAGDATSGNGSSNGRADANGGGIAIGAKINATFNDLTLTGNQSIAGDSSVYGGYASSGGIHIELATVAITDAVIKDNTATSGAGTIDSAATGAGVIVNQSIVTLNRVSVLNNQAFGAGTKSNATGGGIYVISYTSFTSLVGNNLVVANNLVTGAGGGYSRGGGLGIDASGYAATITLNHATFSGNQLGAADQGIAINSFGSSKATINVNYSIIANHTNTKTTSGAVFVGPGTTINLNHTLWDNNINNWAVGGTVNDRNPHSGNPLFVSPGLPNYDYHIQTGSAAINLASGSTISTDIDGESRPYGSVSDIGVDENIPPLENSFTTVSPGNINPNDGNGPDYAVTYTTVVKNSSGQAMPASLTDVLPSPGSPISVGNPTGLTCSTVSCNTAGGNVTWSGTVPANGQVTISYTLQFNIPSNYANTVSIPDDVTIRYSGYPDVNFSGVLFVNGKLVYLPIVIK
jgi:hypothetical protein